VPAPDLRSRVRPLFLQADGKTARPTKVIYDVLGWLLTMTTLNYICTSFVLLSATSALALYKSLYYSTHLATVALLVIFSVLPAKKAPKAVKTA